MSPFTKGRYTRGVLLSEHATGADLEQSSSLCNNDSMGIHHPREQNFHPAKCSKYLGARSRGKLSELENAPSCVLTLFVARGLIRQM